MRIGEYRKHAQSVGHQLDHKYDTFSNKNVFTDDLFVFLFLYLRLSKSRNNPKKEILATPLNLSLRPQLLCLILLISVIILS